MKDATLKLLNDAGQPYNSGALAKRFRSIKPAKRPLSKGQAEMLGQLMDPRTDRTIGFISNALIYGNFGRSLSVREYSHLISLVKGGFVKIAETYGSPPKDSLAWRDSPYGTDRFYTFEPISSALDLHSIE